MHYFRHKRYRTNGMFSADKPVDCKANGRHNKPKKVPYWAATMLPQMAYNNSGKGHKAAPND